MKINFFFFIIFFFYSITSNSTNIKVVDMQIIIDNSESLKSLYNLVENDQKQFLNNFKNEEASLEIKLSEINELKMILNAQELDKEIDIYNELLNNFNYRVEKFNIHYDNQINIHKNIIINKVVDLLKEYSLENNVDLILDANNYILSNNSININDFITTKLNEIIIESNFEKYK
ncbi:MAG: OmpH family outer membrane protein [Pelagibacteraceae bacterium]|nr:OmpH family outer membrane protein [Pelagibacteraceae bacterium]